MFSAIYIEEEVVESQRVKEILARLPDLPITVCKRYGEIFNRNKQNFRLQKRAPALILAKKYGRHVLPTPGGYGFNQQRSFYFSHMLNCIYDCRYCFLQGMYRSANALLFVNYEDFESALIEEISRSSEASVYYSGYDCDSLALEPVSRFCEYYLPVFARFPQATLEIRTKSTQIRSLLEQAPLPNCVIAMSFTPHESSVKWESKVPAIAKRIEALYKLQKAGWRIALRFEPVLFGAESELEYLRLFEEIFSKLDASKIHSVSTGLFRMPTDYFKNIVKLYPDEPLFARETVSSNGLIGLRHEQEAQLLQQIEQRLLGFISMQQYYRCAS